MIVLTMICRNLPFCFFPLRAINHLVFSFSRFGIKTNRGVEFRYSIRSASRCVWQKMETECLSTRFPVGNPAVCRIQPEAKKTELKNLNSLTIKGKEKVFNQK